MRVESNCGNSYSIYLNNLYIKDVNLSAKEEVGLFIKDLIVKLKNIYGITFKGFYEVEVYINKVVGVYMEIKKNNRYDFYMDEIDLKININYDSKVYYKTFDYFIINKYNGIKYKEGYYYIDIGDINNITDGDIIKLVECGTFSFVN